MAITQTQLITAQSSTNTSTNYPTAVLTVTANRLYVFGCLMYESGATNNPTLTGASLTWTRSVYTRNATNASVAIFWAVSSAGSSGALAFNVNGGSATGAAWDIEEFNGIDLVTPIGNVSAGTDKGTATSGSAAISSVAADSAVYSCFGIDSNETINAGSGYAATGVNQGLSTEGAAFRGFYKNPGTTSPGASWTSSVVWAGAGIEIKIASAGGSRPVKMAAKFGGYAGRSGGFAARNSANALPFARRRSGLYVPERLAA